MLVFIGEFSLWIEFIRMRCFLSFDETKKKKNSVHCVPENSKRYAALYCGQYWSNEAPNWYLDNLKLNIFVVLAEFEDR